MPASQFGAPSASRGQPPCHSPFLPKPHTQQGLIGEAPKVCYIGFRLKPAHRIGQHLPLPAICFWSVCPADGSLHVSLPVTIFWVCVFFPGENRSNHSSISFLPPRLGPLKAFQLEFPQTDTIFPSFILSQPDLLCAVSSSSSQKLAGL